MRITERKEVVHTKVEEVTIGRICDYCGKEIKPIDTYRPNSDEYNYFYICTHHHDWGNDSIESYESFDACSPECALKLAEAYLKEAHKNYCNTKEIEISHVRSLSSGTDRDYNLTIEGMKKEK